MSASNYFELQILDHMFFNGAYTAPTTSYVALCTAAPTDASTGSTIVEATYTGYARKSTTATEWGTAAAAGAISNDLAITFAPCTGGTSTVTHFAICDSLTTGEVLFWGAVDSDLAVSNGITPEFAASALTVTCD